MPLNDSLTRFRIVAVADRSNAAEGDRYGTGEASIRLDLATRNLPRATRSHPQWRRIPFGVTLRNSTTRPIVADVTAEMNGAAFAKARACIESRAERRDHPGMSRHPPMARGGHVEFRCHREGRPRGDALRIKQALQTRCHWGHLG